MSELPRIFVDDADTDLIEYTGPWFASTTTQFDTLGHSGAPFRGTLHGTTSNASFSFTYNGTWVAFYGTFNESESSPSSAPVPSVQCVVLVSNIVATTGFISGGGNNVNFCDFQSPLADGQHTVIVNVIYPQTNSPSITPQTFWFDSIEYEASPLSSLNNAMIIIAPPDPRMQFSPEWTPALFELFPPEFIGNKTNTKNSTLTMNFIGESLSWFSFLNRSVSTEATTASYAIDVEPPTIFNINASQPLSNSVDFNILLFQTPTYENGPHTLTVVYNGDAEDNSTPLSLDYVVIQNGSSISANLNISSSSSVLPTASQSVSVISPILPNTRRRIGPIVGGALGGITFIVIVASLMFFLLHWRRKKGARSSDDYSIDETLDDVPPPVNPFMVSREDIVNSKELGLQSTVAETELSATPTAVGAPPETRKTRIRHAHNPSVVSTDLGEDYAFATRPFSNEARALRPKNSASSPTSLPLAPNSTPEMASLSNSQPVSRASRVVVRDEDSGIRLSRQNGGEVVLLPPEYTLS